ncbi:MAG: Fic family protein [Oligoflexales bacterium]
MKYFFSLLTSIIAHNSFSCPEVFEKWPLECEIHDRYQAVKENFDHEFDLDVRFLTEYRTIRLIPRALISQVKPTSVQNPWDYYQDPLSWQYWEKGSHFMESLATELSNSNQNFKLMHLQHLHKKLIDKKRIIMGKSRYIPGAKPGKLRAWHSIFPSVIAFARDQFDSPLSPKQYAYLNNYDIKDQNDRSVLRLRSGLSTQEGQLAVLYYLEAHRIEGVLRHKIKEFNKSWRALKANDTTQNISPIELAATFQKTLISIHPFHEGNGRVTRLVEDTILTSFGLPYVPSGDLTDDLLDPIEQYAAKTRTALLNLVQSLENCLKHHRRSKLTQQPVPPMCRTLYHSNPFDTAQEQKERRLMRLRVLKALPKDQEHPLGTTGQKKESWKNFIIKKWKSQPSFSILKS